MQHKRVIRKKKLEKWNEKEVESLLLEISEYKRVVRQVRLQEKVDKRVFGGEEERESHG